MQILHYIISRQKEKVYQKDIGIALNLRRATLSENSKNNGKKMTLFLEFKIKLIQEKKK